MLTMKRVGHIGAAAVLCLVATSPAGANTSTDEAASILVAAKVVAQEGAADTLLQISNVNHTAETHAHCVYVNANSHCSNNGKVCSSSSQCVDGLSVGSCEAGWIEHNFDLVLTAEQPVAWAASQGLGGAGIGDLDDLASGYLPCPGLRFIGQRCPNFPIDGVQPGDQSNAGTRVPPVGETPFIGELKCIQSDERTRRPVGPCGGDGQDACPADALTGTATIFRVTSNVIDEPELGKSLDAAQYNMVGMKSAGLNDGNGVLNIGGEAPEYAPCPKQLILDHLFDGALDPIDGAGRTQTELTLVPCTQDFRTGTINPVNAQFLIYNEFEQRFSTAKRVDCLLDSPLSRIDTSQPTRSVFHAAVAGTMAGQTFISPVGGGLLGTAVLNYLPNVLSTEPSSPEINGHGSGTGSAGYNLIGMGDRTSDGDRITIP